MAALVLALGACEARAEIEVRENGSGTVGFSFVIEDKYIDLLTQLPGDASSKDPFAEMKKELAASKQKFDVQEFTEPGAKGLRGTLSFKDVEELKTIMLAANEKDESGPLGGRFQDFKLERRGEGWHFSAKTPAADLGDFGGTAPGGIGPSFPPGQLSKLVTLSFRVTLPGAKKETTADRTESKGDGTTFIWQPDLEKPKPLDLVATTGPKSAFAGLVIPAAATLGGLALAGAAFMMLSKRRKTAWETAGSPVPFGTPATEPTPYGVAPSGPTTPFGTLPPPPAPDPPLGPPQVE